MLRHNYIQNVKDGFQIRVYAIRKENKTHFGLNILGTSQAQFQEKVRKLRLRLNDGFL